MSNKKRRRRSRNPATAYQFFMREGTETLQETISTPNTAEAQISILLWQGTQNEYLVKVVAKKSSRHRHEDGSLFVVFDSKTLGRKKGKTIVLGQFNYENGTVYLNVPTDALNEARRHAA